VVTNLLREFDDAVARFILIGGAHAVSQIVAEPTTRSPS
jgi:hypothetical protein